MVAQGVRIWAFRLGTGARAGCGLLRVRNEPSHCQKSLELGGQGGHVGDLCTLAVKVDRLAT